jgi:glycosyltransferase involved in cell wall biosynthesis
MKIAIVSHTFNPRLSGAAGVAYDLAARLKKSGQEVVVFTGDANSPSPAIAEMPIFRTKIAEWRWMFRAYVCVRNPRIEKSFQQFLNETRPAVVHFHNLYYQFPWSLIKIAKRHGCRVLFTAHDSASISQQKLYHFIDSRYGPDNIAQVNYYLSLWEQLRQNGKAWNPLRNFFIKYYLSYADKVIAVSNELKKALEQNGVHNTAVVYNGIDVGRWSANSAELEPLIKKYNLVNKKVILLAGRLSYQKGLDEALRALRLVVKAVPTAVLLIVGSNYEYANGLIDELGLRSNVILAGAASREEMRLYYHLSDVVVMPSLCLETFGMVALEAMACAKPVVGTIFGGVREVVRDAVTGYIVNPLQTRNFADKLIGLLSNHKRVEDFGKAGYERARGEFSLERQMNEYLCHYESKV